MKGFPLRMSRKEKAGHILVAGLAGLAAIVLNCQNNNSVEQKVIGEKTNIPSIYVSEYYLYVPPFDTFMLEMPKADVNACQKYNWKIRSEEFF